MRTEIVTIIVMMIEWVTMEEFMIAAAITVTTFEEPPGSWPPALEVGARPPGIGAGRSLPVVSLAGSIWSESTASAPFAHGMKAFVIQAPSTALR